MPAGDQFARTRRRSVHRTRVLLVSGKPKERSQYADALVRSGYCTLQAESGADGQRLCVELAPSLIVVHVNSDHPDEDLLLLHRFKHERWERGVPVLLLLDTPLADSDDETARAHCDVLLVKPFTVERVTETVNTLLSAT